MPGYVALHWLQAAGMPVVHYQWAPVAGDLLKLARLLERLQ